MPKTFTDKQIAAAAEAGHSVVRAYLSTADHGTDEKRFPNWDAAQDAVKNEAIARVRGYLAGAGDVRAEVIGISAVETIKVRLFRDAVGLVLEAFCVEDWSISAEPEPAPEPAPELKTDPSADPPKKDDGTAEKPAAPPAGQDQDASQASSTPT